METISPLAWFDHVWRVLAKQGKCDEQRGTEYQRVLQEWIAAGSPSAVSQFIEQVANKGTEKPPTPAKPSDTTSAHEVSTSSPIGLTSTPAIAKTPSDTPATSTRPSDTPAAPSKPSDTTSTPAKPPKR